MKDEGPLRQGEGARAPLLLPLPSEGRGLGGVGELSIPQTKRAIHPEFGTTVPLRNSRFSRMIQVSIIPE